jgi:hypothetical protein
MFRQLEIGRWPNKQGLPCECFQTDPFVLPQIARFAAEKEPRTCLHHYAERSADG